MTDFNFFKPTADDIKDAQSGGRPAFKHNEEVTFLITEPQERTDDNGAPLLVIGCQVLSGDNAGKKHSFWYRNNGAGKKQWINLLRALYDDATIQAGGLSPAQLVGRKVSSVCKERVYQGKTYQDFWEYTEVSDAPNLQAVGGDADIPF